MIHYDFRPGQRVLIILRDGSHVVGQFLRSTRRRIELRDLRIEWGDVRSVTIYNRQREKEHNAGRGETRKGENK